MMALECALGPGTPLNPSLGIPWHSSHLVRHLRSMMSTARVVTTARMVTAGGIVVRTGLRQYAIRHHHRNADHGSHPGLH